MTTRSDPTPKSLRSRLKEATSQEILAAAEAVLAEDGLAQAGMATIAQRAGVSVGTLYNYYADKDALLRTLMAERRAQFGKIMETALATRRDAPFEEQLSGLVETVLKTYDSHRSFLRVVFESERPISTEPNEKGRAPFHAFVDRLRPLMAHGVATGVLAAADADLYAPLLAGMLRGVMFDRLHDEAKPYVEAADSVVRIFLSGARTRA